MKFSLEDIGNRLGAVAMLGGQRDALAAVVNNMLKEVEAEALAGLGAGEAALNTAAETEIDKVRLPIPGDSKSSGILPEHVTAIQEETRAAMLKSGQQVYDETNGPAVKGAINKVLDAIKTVALPTPAIVTDAVKNSSDTAGSDE